MRTVLAILGILLYGVLACAALGCGVSFLLSHYAQPQIVEARLPLPWPKPPAPIPNPLPLADTDDKLFGRLAPHFESLADKIAEKRVNAILQEAAQNLDKVNADGELIGAEPTGSVIAILFASALAAFIKKMVVALISALILAAIVGLIVKYWPLLAGTHFLATTIFAYPVAWAAGKTKG